MTNAPFIQIHSLPMMSDPPRRIPELPRTRLPNMVIPSESGSNYNADNTARIELTHDDDVDQGQPVKRQKVQHLWLEGSGVMEDADRGDNVSNALEGLQSLIPTTITGPTIAFDAIPSTSALTLDDDGPIPTPVKYRSKIPASGTSGFKIRIPPISRRVSGALHNQNDLQSDESHHHSDNEAPKHAPLFFFPAPGSISATTSSSLIPSNPLTDHFPPQLSRKLNAFHASTSHLGAYDPTMEEMEEFTHASISPVVFGKKKYVDLSPREDILAMNLRTLRDAGVQTEIVQLSALSHRHHAWGDVAVPTVSRASQRKWLFKDIFGVEHIQVPIYPTFMTPSMGHLNSKTSIDYSSSDSRLPDATAWDLPTTSDEMTSDSSNSPTRPRLSRSSRGYKPHDMNFKHNRSSPVSIITQMRERTDSAEEVTHSGGEDTVTHSGGEDTVIGSQQHEPTEKDDLLKGRVASSDDKATVELESSQVATSEFAHTISPIHQPAAAIPPSPKQDVVELISPMVIELQNSTHFSPPPADFFTFGQAFTLNADSALAMPNNPPKPHDATSSSHLESSLVQEILEPLENLTSDTQEPSSPLVQNQNSSDILMFDHSATHSPGNSLAVNLPPQQNVDAHPFGSLPNVTDISVMEEEEIQSYTPLTTIYDPGYSKSRCRNLWAEDRIEGLHAWVSENTVVGELLDVASARYTEEAEPDEQDEEEIDELDSDQGDVSDRQESESMESPSKRRKTNHPGDSDITVETEDVQLFQSDNSAISPRGLSDQVKNWSLTLHSLIKGKKRFQQQDVVAIKDALQGIYDNHRHIASTSPIASTVYTIMNMRGEDIPGADKIGLRSLARKSIRAWGIRKLQVRPET